MNISHSQHADMFYLDSFILVFFSFLKNHFSLFEECTYCFVLNHRTFLRPSQTILDFLSSLPGDLVCLNIYLVKRRAQWALIYSTCQTSLWSHVLCTPYQTTGKAFCLQDCWIKLSLDFFHRQLIQNRRNFILPPRQKMIFNVCW